MHRLIDLQPLNLRAIQKGVRNRPDTVYKNQTSAAPFWSIKKENLSDRLPPRIGERMRSFGLFLRFLGEAHCVLDRRHMICIAMRAMWRYHVVRYRSTRLRRRE